MEMLKRSSLTDMKKSSPPFKDSSDPNGSPSKASFAKTAPSGPSKSAKFAQTLKQGLNKAGSSAFDALSRVRARHIALLIAFVLAACQISGTIFLWFITIGAVRVVNPNDLPVASDEPLNTKPLSDEIKGKIVYTVGETGIRLAQFATGVLWISTLVQAAYMTWYACQPQFEKTCVSLFVNNFAVVLMVCQIIGNIVFTKMVFTCTFAPVEKKYYIDISSLELFLSQAAAFLGTFSSIFFAWFVYNNVNGIDLFKPKGPSPKDLMIKKLEREKQEAFRASKDAARLAKEEADRALKAAKAEDEKGKIVIYNK